MTPSVSRMVAARRQELAYPLRWYSIPRVWRYERPQRGRLREHWQLNVDIFGVATIDAELELISLADAIMLRLGADESMYELRINSRRLMNLIFNDYLELDIVQSNLMAKLFDKKDKMEPEAFEREAAGIIGDDTGGGMAKLRRLIKAKSLADMPESIKESKSMREIQILFTLLKENNIDNARFDVSLMRGFDYYTDIVFEIFDKHPDNKRSIFGGGRYDGLVGLFGVDNVPTAGFGLGDVTLLNFMESHGLTPKLDSETDIYIVVVGDLVRQANGIAKLLRQEGVNVAVDFSGRQLDKQIKSAAKKQIRYALFVGEDELASERFTLKDLATGKEEKRALPRVVSIVKDERNQH